MNWNPVTSSTSSSNLSEELQVKGLIRTFNLGYVVTMPLQRRANNLRTVQHPNLQLFDN